MSCWLFISVCLWLVCALFFFFKQKTAYEMRISDWSSDVCSSDLEVSSVALFGLIASLIVAVVVILVGTYTAINNVNYPVPNQYQIGRASCRERVCQYV